MQLLKTIKETSTINNPSQFKVLCLENISKSAIDIFEQEGFQVVTSKDSMTMEQLKSIARNVHLICIRSKTQLTKELINNCHDLLAIGCFCIGYNQVDLIHSIKSGIPVFNSPFCNSRSVAEMVLCEIIMLSRCLGDRNIEMHLNKWNKQSSNCYEIRGKILGIVGYGHIGTQLAVLAESVGLKVYFYDIIKLMPIGSAIPTDSLNHLLNISDFVTLHVPAKKDTQNLINENNLSQFKKNSYLINASRGSVVDLKALKKYLDNGHLLGAALDVYPTEPSKSKSEFLCDLSTCKNVILTPHIGGSTEEAQNAIGIEVASKLTEFLKYGNTIGAVNYPNLQLRTPKLSLKNKFRILFAHKNLPGILREINDKLADYNVDSQTCDSKGELAYLMVDIKSTENSNSNNTEIESLLKNISQIENSINTRIISWDNDIEDETKNKN